MGRCRTGGLRPRSSSTVSDGNPVPVGCLTDPFVTYAPDENGIRTSVADYSYGYGRALKDSVVRPVLFSPTPAHDLADQAGDEMSHVLGEETTKDINSQAWRTPSTRRATGSRPCSRPPICD